MRERLAPYAELHGFAMPPNKNPDAKHRTQMEFPELFRNYIAQKFSPDEVTTIWQYNYKRGDWDWNEVHQIDIDRDTKGLGQILVNNRFLYIIGGVTTVLSSNEDIELLKMKDVKNHQWNQLKFVIIAVKF